MVELWRQVVAVVDVVPLQTIITEPVAVATFLKDGEVAAPDMTDPNGATVSSQTVPAGYAAKEGDFYTYAIWDLTKFNERYGTKYYARAYKRFDDSTDTTVELLDKKYW